MKIVISTTVSMPIYEQIINQIRDAVVSGELKAGDGMPSIRVLAKELAVSVITTKRAYEELEKENAELREELEYYRNRKLSGRQKHNAKWMAIYNDFVVGYESGMTMVEIAKRNNVSERTIYRYKAYYDKMKKKEE